MSDIAREPHGLFARLRASLPRPPASRLEWTWLATGVATVAALVWQILWTLAPLLTRPGQIGRQGWDAAAALRYLPVKSILRFHQFPSWNPYACGGHPAWAAPSGDPNVASPLLPLYLALPLARALHAEVVVFTVAGAVGTWLLASRFTRSPALRALAAVVFALDGRWTLQIAAGHLWHLGYALVPWTLFFLDRAVDAAPELGLPRRGGIVGAAVCLALLVYCGDAYLFPQVAFLFVAYAAWLTVAARSARPLVALARIALLAAGLAAPKLVPAIDVAIRYPRVVAAGVSVSPAALSIALLDPKQGFRGSAPGVGPDVWSEVGLYVGFAGAAWLALGAVLASGRREQALRAIAAVFVALGLGPFHPGAPWLLARTFPLMSSQEMPSRWLYLGVLVLACAAADVSEQWLARSGRGRAWIEAVLAIGVVWAARDVATVARRPLDEEIRVVAAATPEQTGSFVTEAQSPAAMRTAAGDESPAALPAERANVGTIECDTFLGLANASSFGSRFPGHGGRPAGVGARGRGDGDYHGEAFVQEGRGAATITAWSPDAVDVTVRGAQPGDHLVLNQNDDPGWSVDGADRASHANAVAAALRSGDANVRFRYRSRGAWLGAILFVVTLGAALALRRARRRVAGVLSTESP